MASFEMIVDDELDEPTIQDALRILNELQSNLSVPYKQRKMIATMPTEKQTRRMLKDIHVLEVQCLEVAAIAYHFGRKCKMYKEDIEALRKKGDSTTPRIAGKDADIGGNALATIETLLLDEREATQRVETTLERIKDVLRQVKTVSESRADEVKRQLSQGFKDLEKLFAAVTSHHEAPESINGLSVRDSLTVELNEREDREMNVEACEYVEIRGKGKLKTHRQVQTIDEPRIVTPIRRLGITSFATSIPPTSPSLAKPSITSPPLTIVAAFSLSIAAPPPRRSLPFAAPLQLSEARSKPDFPKCDISTSVISIVPLQPQLEFTSCEIAEILREEPDLTLWRPPTIEIVPEAVKAPSLQVPESSDEDGVTCETQTTVLMEIENIEGVWVQGAKTKIVRVERGIDLTIEAVRKTGKVGFSVLKGVHVAAGVKQRRLEITPCEPIAIRSWSLLEVFTFTEEPMKEEEANDPTAKKRNRRRVVRKDPIEEFFTLVSAIQTLQAAKLNQPSRENVPRIDAEALYRRAIQEGVPFNRWSEWLHQILRVSGQKTPR